MPEVILFDEGKGDVGRGLCFFGSSYLVSSSSGGGRETSESSLIDKLNDFSG